MLAGQEYADLRPSWIDRMWSALLDALGRLIDLLGQTGQAGIIGSVILLAVLAVLVVGVIRLLGRVRAAPGIAGPEVRLAGRSAADWTAEATEHEAARRWRQALRCHHRALVAELAAAGLVEEMPGRTAAEYEAETVAAVPDASEAMGEATRHFERAWYAKVEVTADDIGELRRAAHQVRQAAGLRVPAGRP